MSYDSVVCSIKLIKDSSPKKMRKKVTMNYDDATIVPLIDGLCSFCKSPVQHSFTECIKSEACALQLVGPGLRDGEEICLSCRKPVKHSWIECAKIMDASKLAGPVPFEHGLTRYLDSKQISTGRWP